MVAIPKTLKRKHLLKAMRLIDSGVEHPYKSATGYLVHHKGKTYWPKAVIGVAWKLAFNLDEYPLDFSGGKAAANRVLTKEGFTVKPKDVTEPLADPFEFFVSLTPGEVVLRPEAKIAVGGNWMAGIIRPKGGGVVVCIDDPDASRRTGFHDGPMPDGRYKYYGQKDHKGEIWHAGNLNVLKAEERDEPLVLLRKVRDNVYRYLGEFGLEDHEETTTTDKDGAVRPTPVFFFRRLGTAPASESAEVLEVQVAHAKKKPKKKNKPKNNGRPKAKKGTTVVYDRDAEVIVWVLERADGVCDGCEQPGPFERKDGSLYLEVHHVERLADGGDDAVENAVALCPNCHRRAHSGKDRKKFKRRLAKVAAAYP